MKAHEIIERLPDEAASEIFLYLYQNDKRAYRACLEVLASRRKLRPVILERKVRAERHSWMRAELGRKANEDAATELLQTWLLGAHPQLICSFLDSLGIPHDGRGLIDTLPPQPAKERLQEDRKPFPICRNRLPPPVLRNGHCRLADSERNSQPRFPTVPRIETAGRLTPFQSSLNEALDTFETLRALEGDFAQAVDTVRECLRSGGKLLICGNGGSAADSAHIAMEFTCRFNDDRRPYPAIALSADGGLLTAIANDYGFQDVFSRQIWAFAKPGDVLIALSTSGKSRNILSALEEARRREMKTIAFLGKGGGFTAGAADIDLIVRSGSTARIQEAQKFLLHILCEMVESALAAG